MKKRPNLVFIQNDHQAYYRWGWDGGEKPKRPHFDAFTQEGATFTHAYCATPLCGPTRRTMLTGLFPHTHGQIHNYTDPPYDHEVYLDTLKEAGYDSYYYGKWHAGPGAAAEHGAPGFSMTGYGNPYTHPQYKEYLEERGLPQANHRILQRYPVSDIVGQGDWVGLEPGADYQCKDIWCGEHAIGVTTTPKETHESFFLANLACEKLEELAARDSDEPFALRVDFWGPHQPHFPTQEYLDMYPKDTFTLPEYGNYASALEGKPLTFMKERSFPFGVDDVLQMPSVYTWEEWIEVMRHCYAHITMVDDAGGMIINKLKELGLDENTLIIWTTDHGDAVGSHGGHFDKGSYMCEEVLRIPFSIAWKGHIEGGQIRDELINTTDFPVTLLDAAGLEYTENEVHGKSILPLVTGEETSWREDQMLESYGHGYGDDQLIRILVNHRYKLVKTRNHLSELYDLENDPYELTNLAEDETYRDVMEQMEQRLKAWQEDTKDPDML